MQRTDMNAMITADGQAALHHAAQADAQRIVSGKGPGRAAQVVRPVAGGLFIHLMDVPLGTLVKLQGRELDDAVFLGAVGNMYALVNRKPRDLSKVVVTVRTNRADAVGTEGDRLRLPKIDLLKLLQ